MAQSGYTPILIYASSTPGALPSAANLTSSASGAELAINYADGKLYFKNSSGVVTLLAGSSSGPAGGSNTQVQYNSSGVLAGSSNMTFNGTKLTVAGFLDSALTSGRVPYATTSGELIDSANLLYSGTDLTVYGLTVGRGAGAVSTNTAAGASALAANTSGSRNTAVGIYTLASNQTGANNTAVGHYALTANTASENVAFGDNALFKNTSGTTNTAIGGYGVLFENLTGSYNTAVGSRALYSNTSASNNTAVGYQAGYSNQTGADNVAVGHQALYTNSTGNNNTAVGLAALNVATGAGNTAVGNGAGNAITTGEKNTIIGRYTGNLGGLDIRTVSNRIVLSDGDGNPRWYIDNVGAAGYGPTTGGAVTQATSRTTGVTLNTPTGAITLVSAAGTTTWQTFTVTNSSVAATDTLIVNQKSGTDLYEIHVTAVAAGSFNISFKTTGGTTTEQPVFNYALIKGQTS